MNHICGCLGICQGFGSQGYGRLSWPKNWKPIHLFRYQNNPRNTWISLNLLPGGESKRAWGRARWRDKLRLEKCKARKSDRRKTSWGVSSSGFVGHNGTNKPGTSWQFFHSLLCWWLLAIFFLAAKVGNISKLSGLKILNALRLV